jgi:hypothetical protein
MAKRNLWLAVALGGLDVSAGEAGYQQNDIIEIGTSIGTFVFSFLGVIFMLLMLYGGFTWMTAMGNDSKIKTAKNLIFTAVAGLLIIAVAYAVTAFIGDNFNPN